MSKNAIAEKDSTYIKDVVKRKPTIETIEQLAIEHGVAVPVILRKAEEAAIPIKRANRRRQLAAEERDKQKIRDRTLKKMAKK